MRQEQPAPNGGRAAASPQGDGDGRAMRDAPPDAPKPLDAGSGEPRDLSTNGHGGSDHPDPGRDRGS